MEQYISFAVVGVSAMLCGLGVMSMFAPSAMVKNFSIEPIEAAGYSTVRSVIGGLFLSSVAMLVAGLATGETVFFLAVAITMGVVALGRLVSIVMDGFVFSVLPPLVLEVVFIGVLVTAFVTLTGTITPS